MPVFTCIKKCFHDGRLWEPGGKLLIAESAPHHFIEVKGAEGGVLEKVSATRMAIRRVLEGLDHDDNKLWTNSGKPQVRAIEALAGIATSRDEIEAAYPGFSRDMKPQPLKDAKSDFLR